LQTNRAHCCCASCQKTAFHKRTAVDWTLTVAYLICHNLFYLS
jgi:hypothetical protein